MEKQSRKTGMVLAILPVLAITSAFAYDLATTKVCYVVADAHLDTQWQWTLQTTINQYLPNTLNTNFAHFGSYPRYVFSFEGAYRYYLTKIHHPQLYERLKGYIASGNWAIAGSWVDAVDVNLPSPESLIRHALYGNGYFDREFGKKSIDIFLPDCFGFGYALPTIAAHCGLLGFSSQKFDLWGGWTSTPFPVGRWQGVDGSEIIAALKPGAYGDNQWNLRTEDGDWVYNNSGKEGNPKVWATYDYMGVGDIGGGPDGGAVGGLLNRMNQNDGQEIKVVSAASDSLFRDLLTRIIHKFC